MHQLSGAAHSLLSQGLHVLSVSYCIPLSVRWMDGVGGWGWGEKKNGLRKKNEKDKREY